jgi:hypothetical protein
MCEQRERQQRERKKYGKVSFHAAIPS